MYALFNECPQMHVRFFSNARKITDILILFCTLSRVQEGITAASSAEAKSKASDAASMQGRLLNKQFLLRIGAEADIYNQYGILINIAQTVDILPHDRLDGIDRTITHLEEMQLSIKLENCDKSKPCKWPVYHNALQSLERESKIYDVVVIDDYPGRSGIGAHHTRKVTDFMTKSENINVKESVQKQAVSLLKKLISGFKTDIFSDDERQKIELSRTLTDLETLYKSVISEGPQKTFAMKVEKYIESIRELPVTSLNDVPTTVLEKQFRELLFKLLEDAIVSTFYDENGDVKMKGASTQEKSISKAMLRIFFLPSMNCIKV